MGDSPQANPLGLMSIGAVAAHNIAAFLNLGVEHVGTIEQAIKDEIGAMSTHFTMAFADVQTQYEIEVAKLKAEGVATAERLKKEYDASVAELRATFGI